jgi:hypothetical protein
MKKIVSAPNLAILLACLAWLVGYYGALFALGDPKPVDPSSPGDNIRFERLIQEKMMIVRTALGLSVVFAISPYILAFRRWSQAKIRFTFSLLICSSYLGSAGYYVLIG